MLTLYSALLAQHPRQLTPVRCADPTIVRLPRYFEDVVLETNLAALVVESLLPESQRSLRAIARVCEVGRSARYAFFSVSHDDALCASPLSDGTSEREPILMKKTEQAGLKERFIVIADARFSALLAAVRRESADGSEFAGDEIIWSFEPDIVYSALEYLIARGTAELPTHPPLFSKAVRLRGRIKTYVHDGTTGACESDTPPVAAVPVIYHDRTMGVLMVTSDDPQRIWQENEIMLLRTVADQVAVAVNHARLFQQMQHQALTDGLTGCFNRRFFEIQLERDLHLATYPLHASSRDLLVTTADRALYQAKNTGRNRVCSPADLPLEEMPALPFEPDMPAQDAADVLAETHAAHESQESSLPSDL